MTTSAFCLYIGKKRVRRCGEYCKIADCGMCIPDKKYGGPGRKKKCCEERQRLAINKSEPTHEPQKGTNTGNYVQRDYYRM